MTQTSDTEKWYVYGLVSSGNPELIRYIGVTNNPDKRFKAHMYESGYEPGKWYESHKNRWIRKESRLGNTVSMVILHEYLNDTEAFSKEKKLISITAGLTNTAEGGRGGRTITDPVKKAESVEKLMNYWTPEKRAERGKVLSSLWDDPEYRERMTQVKRDNWKNPEYVAKFWEGLEKAKVEKDYLTKAAESRRNSDKWREGSKRVTEFRRKPENRKKSSEYANRLWGDSEKAEAQRAMMKSQEFRDKVSRGVRKYWEKWDNTTPEARERRSKNIQLGRRKAEAKRNGWLFDIIDITERQECTHET